MADNVGLGEAIGLGTQLRADTSKPITQGIQFGMGMEMRKNAAEAKELQYQRQLQKAYTDKLIGIQGKGGFKTAVANNQLQPFLKALTDEGMSNNPYTQNQAILDFQNAKSELVEVDKLWQGLDNVLKNPKVYIPKEVRSAIKQAQIDGDKDKLDEVFSKYPSYVLFNPDNGATAINEAQAIDFSPIKAATLIGRTAQSSKPKFDFFGNLESVEIKIPESTVSTFAKGTMSEPSALDQYKEKAGKEKFAKAVAEVKKEYPNTDGNITESMYENVAATKMFKDDIMNASGKEKFYQKVQPKADTSKKYDFTMTDDWTLKVNNRTTGFTFSGGVVGDTEGLKGGLVLLLPKLTTRTAETEGYNETNIVDTNPYRIYIGKDNKFYLNYYIDTVDKIGKDRGTYNDVLKEGDKGDIASASKISVPDLEKMLKTLRLRIEGNPAAARALWGIRSKSNGGGKSKETGAADIN